MVRRTTLSTTNKSGLKKKRLEGGYYTLLDGRRDFCWHAKWDGMIFRSFLSPVTKRHAEQKLLRTHPLHLFRIIQDVDRYAEFLPLCSSSQVNKTLPNDGGFEATLTVGLPPLFSETYRSRVTVIPHQLVVETKSLDGKYFDHLASRWKLKAVENTGHDQAPHCMVDFQVEITASDPVIVSTLDQVLERIAGDQVRAFDQRCRQIPLPEDLKIVDQ